MSTKNIEHQPLLNDIITPAMPSSSQQYQQQQHEKPPPQWYSYKHPEIKHELILYAELAAAAAFIVGLYVLCLLPWEYIHRAEMLSSRLQPPSDKLTIQHVKSLRDSCDINDETNFTIPYKLTKRPCKTEEMPKRQVPMDFAKQYSVNCDTSDIITDEHRFKLGKASHNHPSTITRYSYHDLNSFFHIDCCANTATNCPCGFDQTFHNKCYALAAVGNSICSSEMIFNSTIELLPQQLKTFLVSQGLKYYCNEEGKFDFNGTKISSCDLNTSVTFSGDKNNAQFYLCESDFIDKRKEWWRKG